MLVIGVGLVGITYLMTSSDDGTPAKKNNRSRTASSSRGKASQYTEEDYKAKFPVLNSSVKNSFRPIIARTTMTLEAPEGPTGIPADLAGGEAGWTYTGTVEVNGVTQALLENPTTGAGDFVRVGDTWKKARVMGITQTEILLSGPAGTAKIKLRGTEEALPTGGIMAPARVRPPISGPIGPLSIQPEQPNRRDTQTLSEGDSDAN
jgi:hypothetical protein